MKTQTRPQAKLSTIKSMVDRFCDLQNQLSFVDSLVKERDSLRKQLAEYADSISGEAVKITGNTSYVSFTKPPMQREVKDINGYFEAVTFEDFLSSVKISTSSADKLLNETQKTKLFETSFGSRRVKDYGELMQAVTPRQGVRLFEYLVGLNTQAR